MGIWGRLVNRLVGGTKSNVTAILNAGSNLGRALWTPTNYTKLSEEGYEKCIVAFRCINEIASAVSTVPWYLYEVARDGTRKEVLNPDDPIKKLLDRPNPNQGWPAFIAETISYLLISGNNYTNAQGADTGTNQGIPVELYNQRPDYMNIVPGPFGISRYEYSAGGSSDKIKWEVTQPSGESMMKHLKLWHPTNSYYGLSPMQAAARNIDIYNSINTWSKKLLDNDARPAGYLTTEGELEEEQRETLQKELEERYQGAMNAGRPLVLEGGLKFFAQSISPKDLDWLNGLDAQSRFIATAYRVPAQVVGIKGENTYSNMELAWQALWENPVIFYLNIIRSEYNHWLLPKFRRGNLVMDYDLSGVPALAGRRDTSWIRAQTSSFLSINEKRELAGYDSVVGGDLILIPAGVIPLELAGEVDIEAETAAKNARAGGEKGLIEFEKMLRLPLETNVKSN